MKNLRKKQKAVHRHCTSLLNESERKAERESIAKIEAYKKYEKHAYRRIEKERRERDPSDRPIPEHKAIEEELDSKILDLQSELLDIEMQLQDALKTSSKLFFQKIKSIIEDMGAANGDFNA